MLWTAAGIGILTKSPGCSDCAAPRCASPQAQCLCLGTSGWVQIPGGTGALLTRPELHSGSKQDPAECSQPPPKNILSFQDANLNFLQNFFSRFITTRDVQGHSREIERIAARWYHCLWKEKAEHSKVLPASGGHEEPFPKSFAPDSCCCLSKSCGPHSLLIQHHSGNPLLKLHAC